MVRGARGYAISVDPGDLALTGEHTGPAPGPEQLSWPRLRRQLSFLVLGLAVVVAAVVLTPGLDSLRHRFADARPAWIAVAACLKLLSCLSYVLVFRAVFCRQLSWRTSYQIGMTELATNSLVSVGGAGGLAVGAWILRRGGMSSAHVARRTVAFFLLTSAANVTALILVGVGLGSAILHGAPSRVMGFLPAIIGVAAVAVVLALSRIARTLARRTSRTKVAVALEHVAAGVGEALTLLRRGDPALIAGAAGYMLFDVATLGACFAAFGNDVPAGGVVVMAYLIGQLGGLIPLPGGVGGVDGGLIGALVLYGIGAAAAASAVLAYRGLVLLLPVALGIPTSLVLQRRLRQERHDIANCAPDGDVEIMGRGRIRLVDLDLR